MEWKDRDSIKKDLNRLEQNVNTFYLHFLVSASINGCILSVLMLGL